MNTSLIQLKWTRPRTAEFPKIWTTFHARDIDSEKIVEYRIQDLPENRFADAVEHMVSNYLKDEPMTHVLSKFYCFSTCYID